MPLSPAVTPYVQASSSPLVLIPLLTITLPGKPALRVCDNTVDVISRGETFQATHFEVTLANDDPDKLPEVQLRIANVTGEIVEYLRALVVPPTIKLEIVSNVDFDVVEKSIDFLRLVSIGYDALLITGTLQVDTILSRKFPDEQYIPPHYPGLFAIGALS